THFLTFAAQLIGVSSSMTICFDFGNTRLKAAVFTDGALTELVILKDHSQESVKALMEKFHPQKTILSSVIDHDSRIEYLFSSVSRFHKLNHLSKLPFTTPVGKPETIGADRLALA